MKKFVSILLAVAFCACMTAGLAACNKSYEIGFNTGCEVSVGAIKASEGENVTLPAPEREGYAFEGWFDNESFTGSPVQSVKASANVTFYAKWAKLYVLTLDANGGALEGTELQVKAGEKLQTLLSGKTPVKTGLIFGQWFNGQTEINESTAMPSSDLTLTARYKAQYTVELFKQRVSDDEYETETVTGYEYVGKTLTIGNDYEGFEETEKSDSVSTLAISENAAENVFRKYLNRKEYSLTFKSVKEGYGETKTITLRYGAEYAMPNDVFEKKGYWLTGWESADGKAYTTGRKIFNDSESSVAADEITVSKNATFTAVWLKGYVNVFGGDDYIYRIEGEEDSVYLLRGGLIFKGEYNSSRKEFFFDPESEENSISGKLNDDGSFAYREGRRAGTAQLFTVTDGIVKDTKIVFDSGDGITYSVGNDSSKGYYRIDDQGQYVATFESGSLKGKTLVIVLGVAEEENTENGNVEEVRIFRVRNDNEYKIGKMYRALVHDGMLTYYTYNFTLTLDGFGVATYSYYNDEGVNDVKYYYVYGENGITLKNDEDKVVGVAVTVEINGATCYMLLDSELKGEFTDGGSAILKLDGLYNAEYVDGDLSVKGYYTAEQSVFGGKIITVTSAGKTYRFLLKEQAGESSDEVVGGGESEESETVYYLEKKGNDYKEYYFKGEGDDGEIKLYFTPMFVVDDSTESGKASLYGYTDKGEYVLVSTGAYTFDKATAKATYQATWFADPEAVSGVVNVTLDVAKITSFECYLTEMTVGATTYSVSYWYSYRTEEAATDKTTVYVSDNDGETLAIIYDMAVYKTGAATVRGTITKEGAIVTLVSSADPRNIMYFELNEDNKTFVLLGGEPCDIARYMPDGTVKRNERLIYDGKKAVYQTENGEIEGAIENTNKSSTFGAFIYRFTSADGSVSFEYIRIQNSVDKLFAVYDSRYDYTYVSDDSDSDILTLDGFGFYCEYKVGSDVVYKGVYYTESETCVRITVNGVDMYFDLDGYTYVLRGKEYGVFTVADNGFAKFEEFYELDGYSVIKAFTVGEDGSRTYVGEGTYKKSGSKIAYRISVGADEKTGELAVASGKVKYKDQYYGILAVLHEEVVSTYINPDDWSMLVLDDAGGATKIDASGIRQTGGYTLITDSLLYFYTGDGSDGCIFRYDRQSARTVPVKFSARGYYTKELDSLLFADSGFAIFNGTERCYYDLDEDDNVIIYKKDESATNASEYGFTEENFGKFDSQKVYGGKTYYSNNGFAIRFEREEQGKEKYPVVLTTGSSYKYPLETLSFAPTGKAEFNVYGEVVINGRSYRAIVSRETDESGVSRMYMYAGSYVFDIELNFKGEDDAGNSLSTYDITGMRGVISAPAYKYLDNYYKVYVTSGAKYAENYQNNIGNVYINYVYDEEGEQISEYVSATFGESSEYYDADGNVLSIENASFIYDNVNRVYVAEFVGADGFTYRFAFSITKHSAYKNTYGYYVHYLVRVETLEAGNGYVVETERYIGSDRNIAFGAIGNIKLTKDGEELDFWNAIVSGDKTEVRYVSRTYDGGRITATTYYTIRYVIDTNVEIGENDKILPVYKSATVIATQQMTIAYTEDGNTFVDIDEENNVVLFATGKTAYIVTASEYDEQTGVYTVTAGGKTYTFKLSSDGKTITDLKTVE